VSEVDEAGHSEANKSVEGAREGGMAKRKCEARAGEVNEAGRGEANKSEEARE
jgi:hypothetical protein